MADLVIDYELLYDASSKLNTLQSEIHTITKTDQGRSGYTYGANGNVLDNELGPGPFANALIGFYDAWSAPLSNAGDQITKLSATFKGVAQAFFDADASSVGAINAGVALSNARNYAVELAAYEQALLEWQSLPNPNHVPYYTADGVEHFMKVPPPTAPTVPGTTYTGPGGATTTFTTGPSDPNDPNHGLEITSETTTVSVDGQNYSETTTFGPDKGWVDDGPVQDTKSVVNHSDGSTDTITTTTNLDGSATTVDVNQANGKTTTSTETRANWDADWVPTPNPQVTNSNGDSPDYQK